MLRNRDSVAKFELRVRVTDRRMRTVLLYDGAMEDLAAVNEAYFKWLDLPWTKVALDTQGWFHYVPLWLQCVTAAAFPSISSVATGPPSRTRTRNTIEACTTSRCCGTSSTGSRGTGV